MYKPEDYFLIRNAPAKIGVDTKLKPTYRGPYLVDKVLNKNRYVIKDIPGFNVTTRQYNSILSPARMKSWTIPIVRSDKVIISVQLIDYLFG